MYSHCIRKQYRNLTKTTPPSYNSVAACAYARRQRSPATVTAIGINQLSRHLTAGNRRPACPAQRMTTFRPRALAKVQATPVSDATVSHRQSVRPASGTNSRSQANCRSLHLRPRICSSSTHRFARTLHGARIHGRTFPPCHSSRKEGRAATRRVRQKSPAIGAGSQARSCAPCSVAAGNIPAGGPMPEAGRGALQATPGSV